MREVSEPTRDLRTRLLAAAAPSEIAALLRRIGESREPAALPSILPFLLVKAQDVARAAAIAAQTLLEATPVTDLPWLDQRLRHELPYVSAFRAVWPGLWPRDLSRLEEEGDSSFCLLAVAASHRSGFVREEALTRLARIKDGRELPFLLLRLNDWVEKVAALAQAAVQERLHPGYAIHFAACLPLIFRLRHEHRRRRSIEFAANVVSLLEREEGRAALAAALAPDRDREVRRACASVLFGAAVPPSAEDFAKALSDRDPVVRLRAARKLGAVPEDARKELLARMIHDPFMPVRREAFEASVMVTPGGMESAWEWALLDPHAAIRHAARRHLAQHEQRDFAAFYRRALSRATGRQCAAALAGLSETGGPEDTQLALPFIQHSQARVRAAAIRLLAKLDVQGHTERFLETVETDSGKPAREAVAALQRVVLRLGAERLWRVFSASSRLPAKLAFLRLFESFSKWESLGYLLAASASPEPEVAQAARVHLEGWLGRFNRSFLSPSPDQIARIDSALANAGLDVRPGIRGQLKFLLKSFR